MKCELHHSGTCSFTRVIDTFFFCLLCLRRFHYTRDIIYSFATSHPACTQKKWPDSHRTIVIIEDMFHFFGYYVVSAQDQSLKEMKSFCNQAGGKKLTLVSYEVMRSF